VTAARVVQEALTNALKHAGPGAEVETTVDVVDSRLRVEVANSGPVGPHPALPASGHGLAGMRERVEIHGGTLAAGPTHTGGWRLRVTLPLGART
jgi:signal transduction histidine kinase